MGFENNQSKLDNLNKMNLKDSYQIKMNTKTPELQNSNLPNEFALYVIFY